MVCPVGVQMFDMLLLLSEGRAVYFGPASRVVDYFATVGFQCPPLWNAADWLLDLIAQVGVETHKGRAHVDTD